MSVNTYPGFIISSTTIAVDYWPKNDRTNLTHYFLTHCHTDHTKNLDSSWNGSLIYCSKISKKLLISLNQVKEELIVELDLDKTHIMRLDKDETFNVSLIDANHCPGAVMFLFEGYFGVILATGDFRYDPAMFIDSPLGNKDVDICYLDNTYFNPAYSNIPDREQALLKIIKLIEDKRSEKVLFRLHLRLLGKENLLVDLYEYFRVPIVLAPKRYERYTQVLELSKDNFQVNFDSNSLIFIEDADSSEEFKEFIFSKTVIHIEPSALNIIEKRAKLDSNFFRIPYTDHSSYEEIIEFVKKLRPKRLIPIVRRMLPNSLDTTDLKLLDKYLNPKPILNVTEKYKLLLQSTTSIRRSSRLNNYSLSNKNVNETKKHNQSILTNRNPTPISTRFITVRNRSLKNTKKQIEYDTPEKKEKNNQINENQQLGRVTLNSNKRIISISSNKRAMYRNIRTKLNTIVEENKSDILLDTSNLKNQNEDQDQLRQNILTQESIPATQVPSNQENIIEEDELNSSKENENLVENSTDKKKQKWKRLSEQVELLENNIELNSSLNSSVVQKANKNAENTPVKPKVCEKLKTAAVVLELLSYDELKNKHKLNNSRFRNEEEEIQKEKKIIEPLDISCEDSNDSQDSSNYSIIFEHTIMDKMDENKRQSNVCLNLENISPVRRQNEITTDLNQNLIIDTVTHKTNETMNKENDEFYSFMNSRLEHLGATKNQSLSEMINNHILEYFQF